MLMLRKRLHLSYLALLLSIFLTAPTISRAGSVRAPNICQSLLEPEIDFLAPANYVERLRLLQEPNGLEPLGKLVSSFISRPLSYEGRYYRNEDIDAPKSIRHTFPRDGDKAKSSIKLKEFYNAVYRNYGQSFSSELMSKLSESDQELLIKRTTLGVIQNRDSITGTWRWYEANPNPNKIEQPVSLPYQILNKVRGVPELQVTRKLQAFMDMGFGVTEISKFSAGGQSESTRVRTIHLIEFDWMVRSWHNQIYIAHVTSPAHIRLYKKYSFEIAEEFEVVDPISGESHKEAILWVRGWQFHEALRKCLKLTDQLRWLRPRKQLLPSEFKDPNFHVRR